MAIYISLLRGINVSGQKNIKMDALRQLYESLGFQNVITYVQSGNVIFTSDDADSRHLEQTIAARIEKEFGFVVTVLVLTVDKLGQLIEGNPFVLDNSKPLPHLYVTFLSAKAEPSGHKTILANCRNGEEAAFGDQAVYLYIPEGYGRTRINNNFLESRLNVDATTRNWKTVSELLRLAGQL